MWTAALLAGALLNDYTVAMDRELSRKLDSDRTLARARGVTLLVARGCAIALLVITAAASRGADLSFTDITLAAGTGGPTDRGMTGGHGVAFADVDRDGLPDLLVTMNFDAPMPELFFRNLGRGHFGDAGASSGVVDLDGGSHGATFADLDSDGDYDLWNGTTLPGAGSAEFNNVFRNDGAGRFEDVTPQAIRDATLPTRAVLAFDMDADGDLDLFAVTNYRGSDDPPSERNEVYRNDGGLRFTPIEAGDLASCPAGQGAIDTDFDGDGDIDVIAANRTGDVNVLQNDGKGVFQRVTPSSIGLRHRAPDGISAADFDSDGDLDLLLAGGDVEAVLYENDDSGRFTERQSFSDTEGYMGGFADLDNDGDLDLVFAGDDRVYLNEDGSFSPGPAVPVGGIEDPRGIAFADLDADGDLDFAIGAKRSRNWLVRTESPPRNRWLRVALLSPAGQAGAFGAKVTLRESGATGPGALIGFRESRSNGGYLGEDDPVLHFGAGDRMRVDLEVRFLGGKTITHRRIATNQTVVVDGVAPFLADRIGTVWRPVLEWRIESSRAVEEPYDVRATATFHHATTGEERTTPLFYDGAGGWSFRFTGTRTGDWTFATSSEDQALDGRRGKVRILANPDPSAHGFVKGLGSKWAFEGTERVFVPQLVMYSGEATTLGDPDRIEQSIETFFNGHGFNGFHVPSLGGQWFDHRAGDARVTDSMKDPDPETFAALERLITRTHAAGGFVHIWVWGDHQRRQTSLSLRGGPDGDVSKRLERTIAARLGPLPGWTMGYGFDLQEWAAIPGEVELVRTWHDQLTRELAFPHLLGGRMGPTIPPGSKDHSVQARLNEGLGYYGYEHHRPTYEVYVAAIAALPERPVFSEDRFRIRVPPLYPDKDYNEELTRRGLYHSALAGGVAGIWGNNEPGGWDVGGASRPYPNPELIKTWALFFAKRFTADMEPEPRASSDGFCLAREGGRGFVFYREDADSIEMDLSTLAGANAGVAVDTEKAYREIPLGELSRAKQSWKAPYASDWVLAIGDFPQE